MLEQAISKINAEMQKKPDNPYMEIIGHYLIDSCINDYAAEKLLADGKTLGGAMKAVEDAARKKAKSSVSVMLPAEVFNIVDQYFNLPFNHEVRNRTYAALCGTAVPIQPVKKRPDLRLADFLD